MSNDRFSFISKADTFLLANQAFGIGTILGAGIYVLIGEVAAVAGSWTPASFIIAAVLAA